MDAPVITAPADGSTLTSNSVSVSGTGNGLITLYEGDKVLSEATAADGSWSALLSLEDGEHSLWATASDGPDVSADSEDVQFTVSGQPAPSAEPVNAPAPEGTVVDTPTDTAVVTPVEDPPADPAPSSDAPSPAAEPPAEPPADPAAAPADPADPANPADPPAAEPDPASAEVPADAPPVVDPIADPSVGTTTIIIPEAPVEASDASAEVRPDSQDPPASGTQIDPRASAEQAANEPVEDGASTAPVGTPDAPVIEEPHADQVHDDNLVKVSGTAEPSGATVTVYADSRAIGTASVDDKGDWSLEANLPNAEYVLTATVNDTGRIGPRAETVHIVVNHDRNAAAVEPPTDPDQRLALFLKERILRGYPLRWDNILELRAHAEAWIAAKGL